MLEILRHALIGSPHDINALLLLFVLHLEESVLACQILNLTLQRLEIVLGSPVHKLDLSPHTLLARALHLKLLDLFLELLDRASEVGILLLQDLLSLSMVVD